MNSPPPVPQILSLRASDLILLGKKVLIEADTRATTKVGSLWIPLMKDQSYPTAGWVIGVGPEVENLARGNFVVLEEEGVDVKASYYDVFEIVLRHADGFIETIWAEIETEPVVREQVAQYRRGGVDSTIKVVDKKAGGGISFNCSDVMDFQIGDMANPAFNLTYIPMVMIVMLNDDGLPALFYFTEPDRILATVDY